MEFDQARLFERTEHSARSARSAIVETVVLDQAPDAWTVSFSDEPGVIGASNDEREHVMLGEPWRTRNNDGCNGTAIDGRKSGLAIE